MKKLTDVMGLLNNTRRTIVDSDMTPSETFDMHDEEHLRSSYPQLSDRQRRLVMLLARRKRASMDRTPTHEEPRQIVRNIIDNVDVLGLIERQGGLTQSQKRLIIIKAKRVRRRLGRPLTPEETERLYNSVVADVEALGCLEQLSNLSL